VATIDPHSFSDPTQGTIVRIDFRIDPDLDERVVRVRAEFGLDRPVHGSFFLDVKDLRIGRIEAAGKPVRWALDKHDPILGQRLHLMDLPGVEGFSIESTTSSGAAALQWLEPSQTAGGVHPFLYTQCQACSARTLFPCQDTPGVRFTYQAEISAPPPLVAVMAAEATGREALPDRNVFRFRMPQPIPSYLFAFAVGNISFEAIGPRTGIYAEPETLGAAVREFAENEDRLRAAEALFGSYLWDRYDLLIQPPAAPYGGMENPRLTFLNSCYVIGDRSGVYMVAHELAHAWTGNLVTNASWEEFWLNEGPTTYAETRISEALEGVDAANLRTAGRVRRLLLDIERLGAASPMTCLRLSLQGKHPDESYSNVPYYKGLLFFLRLEQAAGRSRFDAFLHDYIDAFRFRSIDSEQFATFLGERLPDVVRQVDVRRWIYEPGLPEGAPEVHSILLDDVLEVETQIRRGELPSEERVARWTPNQRVVLLGRLLPTVSPEACALLESLFRLKQSRDGDLRSRFHELAVRSGYREALADYETFFASVGRYSFHEPVFRALVGEPWSRARARPLLEQWRHRHHSHTVAAIERILIEAGL
jgi:aminopeptidase N